MKQKKAKREAAEAHARAAEEAKKAAALQAAMGEASAAAQNATKARHDAEHDAANDVRPRHDAADDRLESNAPTDDGCQSSDEVHAIGPSLSADGDEPRGHAGHAKRADAAGGPGRASLHLWNDIDLLKTNFGVHCQLEVSVAS